MYLTNLKSEWTWLLAIGEETRLKRLTLVSKDLSPISEIFGLETF